MDLSFVREKMGRGELPRDDCEETHLIAGGFASCAACDTATTPVDSAFACYWGEKRLILHPDCYVLWEEARKLGS